MHFGTKWLLLSDYWWWRVPLTCGQHMAFFIDESNFSSNYKNWTTLAKGEYAPLLLEECLPYVHYQSFPILDCKGKVLGEHKRAIHGFYFLSWLWTHLCFLSPINRLHTAHTFISQGTLPTVNKCCGSYYKVLFFLRKTRRWIFRKIQTFFCNGVNSIV